MLRTPATRLEDRIRAERNLPYHALTRTLSGSRAEPLATDLLGWCARLALPNAAARYEPKQLRLRILTSSPSLAARGRRPPRPAQVPPALARGGVLGERYARGEINEDEYRQRLGMLREQQT